MSKTVVVLGAGVGGLATAAELRKVLPAQDRILLIDRTFSGNLGLSLLWVMRGWRTPEQVRVKPSAAALPGVQMVTAEVDWIDEAEQTVRCRDGDPIRYDALVIALGAALDVAAVAGLAEALEAGVASQFYTLEGAADLHRRIGALKSGRLMVLVLGVPFKCPAAPFEAAFLIADQLGARHSGGAVRVDTFTPDTLPMPVAGPEVGKSLVSMMEAKGIGFQGGKSATHIDANTRTVEFADGTTEAFDRLVVIPPHRSEAATLISTGIAPNGWIPVDPHTLAASAPGVWAIGDVTALMLPNGKPLPKAAIFAQAEAEVAAHQVARHLGYDAPDTRFTGEGVCYVEIGGGLAAKGEGDFFATPVPRVALRDPSPGYHAEKAQEERDWLARWNIGEASAETSWNRRIS
ncbi:MAG: NAD(P)/FAD-dependent oxidoreductase [Mycobacterium sp.]|uniref:Dehydrogenase n=1 Tax=Mycobacterium gordonae TaxID=1778 RepID=A0A1A6BMD8_MYCGO|nr:FAD/NAD(P)-binding oxidoreductase [Mycobacterium gordonae]MBI2702805.1 NAD(P)/FAD-dependent oxidoreductase [Mycobacterium sp.]OBS03374.1 dehydrogenase [Mycobacterium gordonae]PJE18274.1 MAG: NAD(P)/FAD-dependent oxidoreductase [Mycobacterium sp.]